MRGDPHDSLLDLGDDRGHGPAGRHPAARGPGPVKPDRRFSRCYRSSVENRVLAFVDTAGTTAVYCRRLALRVYSTLRAMRCEKWLSPGGPSEAAPPVPIPNTAVKRLSADDTALARVWENRPLPGFFLFRRKLPSRFLVETGCTQLIASGIPLCRPVGGFSVIRLRVTIPPTYKTRDGLVCDLV